MPVTHWYCIRTSEHTELIDTPESTVEMSCIVLTEARVYPKITVLPTEAYFQLKRSQINKSI